MSDIARMDYIAFLEMSKVITDYVKDLKGIDVVLAEPNTTIRIEMFFAAYAKAKEYMDNKKHMEINGQS